MIQDGNDGNGNANQQQPNVQVSAKEFASKFKSKRGKYMPDSPMPPCRELPADQVPNGGRWCA